jgi:hypothetical protein
VVTALLATALVLPTGLVGGAYVYVHHDDGTPVYEALPAASRAPMGGDGKVSVGYHRCPRDSVCFFSEHNGKGDMCSWRGDDPNWQAGEETCAWAADGPVRSVFNNLAEERKNRDVAYYRGTDFQPAGYDRAREAQRTGCDRINSMDNLAGTYSPRSHRLVDRCSSGETSLLGRFLSMFE